MPIYPIINLKRVALMLSALTLALVAALSLAMARWVSSKTVSRGGRITQRRPGTQRPPPARTLRKLRSRPRHRRQTGCGRSSMSARRRPPG